MRPTQEITVGEHTFVVKTYPTAREANAVRQIAYKAGKVEVQGEEARITEFNPGMQFDVSVEMLRQMIVKMDGSDERIADRCMDLPDDDFDAIVAALNPLFAKKKN